MDKTFSGEAIKINAKISYDLKGLLLRDFIASALFAIGLTLYGAIILLIAAGVLTTTETISFFQWIKTETAISAVTTFNTIMGLAFIALTIWCILESWIEVIFICILPFLGIQHNFDWAILGVLIKQIVTQILPRFYPLAVMAVFGFCLARHYSVMLNPSKMVDLYIKEYEECDLHHFKFGKSLCPPISPRSFGKNKIKFFNV